MKDVLLYGRIQNPVNRDRRGDLHELLLVRFSLVFAQMNRSISRSSLFTYLIAHGLSQSLIQKSRKSYREVQAGAHGRNDRGVPNAARRGIIDR